MPDNYNDLPENSRKMVDAIITSLCETTTNAAKVLGKEGDEKSWDALFVMLLSQLVQSR